MPNDERDKIVSSAIDKALGRRVRAVRQRLRMTVSDLADVVEMSQPQLSRLESGVRSWNYSTASKIADALNVSLYLLQDDSIPLDRLADIAEVMQGLSGLPEDRLDAVLSLLRSLHPEKD